MRLRYSLTQQGMDSDSLNYGGNIFRNNALYRPWDFGVTIRQGNLQKYSVAEAWIAVQPFLKLPLFLDFVFYLRKNELNLGGTAPSQTKTQGGYIALRYSVAFRDFRR